MTNKNFCIDKEHTQLTALARCVHIYGHSDRADELAALEQGKCESAVRWAYCCAGMPAEHIDELMARKVCAGAAVGVDALDNVPDQEEPITANVRVSPVWLATCEEINAALSAAEHIDRESGEEPSPAVLAASRMALDQKFLEEICA